MRYISCTGAGGAERLVLATGPAPVPGDGEVLIRVVASGVNRPDIFQRQGLYPPPEGDSELLGLEVAGEICGLGPNAREWALGQPVCALVNGGGYAEYAVAPARQCLPIPEGLAVEQVAALPEACFTVWHNLWQRAGLTSGETLLIHGGSSGVGTTAIQMARALGVQVYATAGSDAKCRVCEQLGAIEAVNYRERDFVTEIKRLTDGRGVNVILDMVGGDYIQRNMSLAAREGRIVNIAYLKGSKVTLDMLPVMVKRLTLTGSTLRAQGAEVKAGIAEQLRRNVWPLIEQGEIMPVIAARFPLSEVGDAHRLMESGEHLGKIILTTDVLERLWLWSEGRSGGACYQTRRD